MNFSGSAQPVLRFWRWLTEPSASIIEAETQHRARIVTSTLLLSVVLAVVSLLEASNANESFAPLLLLLVCLAAANAFCRTRYFLLGGLIAIAALWLLPTYAVTLQGLDSASFVLSMGRLLLTSLLLAYILFSLRASLLLALLMVALFLLLPSRTPVTWSPLQVASDFFLSTGAVFFILVITRQYDVAERKEAQEALSDSEARYRAIVEIQTEMICRWLPDATLTFVNEAYCRYFAKTREELVGSRMLALIYEDDLPQVKQMITRMSRENPTVTYEHRVFNPAGELRWHQWTDQAIYNEAGQIVEYQSVGRDITDLKRAEEAEHGEREFAEALASTAAVISSTLQLDEVLDRILSQMATIYPLNAAEVLLIDSQGVASIARTQGYKAAEDLERVMRLRFVVQDTPNMRRMVATGMPQIIDDVRSYPDWVDVDVNDWIRATIGAPIRLEGDTIGFLNVSSDTIGVFTAQHAERLQAFADQAAIAIRNARLYDEVRHHAGELEALVQKRTAELEIERQRLRAILDGSGEGIFYTEDEHILFANDALCRLTGYSEDELIGEHIALLSDPANVDQVKGRLQIIRETLQDSGVWRGEIRARRKDGTLFDAGLTTASIEVGDNRQFRSVTVVRDISREKALQTQRSNFVAYASHELRTPITNLKTRLYLLRRRPELLDDHLLVLDEVTERMRQLVEDLLDISRLEHGLIPLRRAAVSLQEIVRSVLKHQHPEAERKALDLRCALTEEPIYVSGDRERLIQVITNLVTNAVNYTPNGGSVTVRVTGNDSTAQVEVEDTGIGIDSEVLPHIFQPFYRVVSEVEGTGLGLSIAKEIVELHGGMLSVRSTPEHGSVFTITLPLLPPEMVSSLPANP